MYARSEHVTAEEGMPQGLEECIQENHRMHSSSAAEGKSERKAAFINVIFVFGLQLLL